MTASWLPPSCTVDLRVEGVVVFVLRRAGEELAVLDTVFGVEAAYLRACAVAWRAEGMATPEVRAALRPARAPKETR